MNCPHSTLRIAVPAAAIFCFCAVLPSCEPEAPLEFRIGLLALTDPGYREASGEPSIQGARLAVSEINEAGGLTLDGRPAVVRLVVREYEGRPDAAATQAMALLNQDSVHVLVGPQISSHAIPVAVIAEAAGVPMISPMSSNPGTTRGKRFVFRLASTDGVLADVVARYARDSLGAVRGAVLFDEAGAYSRELSTRFQESFEAAGGTIVAAERYTTDRATDFSQQLQRIGAADPDVLFLPNPVHHDSAQMRQARELGLEARFLGADSWDLLGFAEFSWAQGSVVAHQWHYDLPTPEVAAFVTRFAAVYGRTPRTTAAMTFDAVSIFVEAVRQAGSLAPEELRARIAAMRAFHGASGLISFHGTGDPERSMAISTIRNGRVEVVGMILP